MRLRRGVSSFAAVLCLTASCSPPQEPTSPPQEPTPQSLGTSESAGSAPASEDVDTSSFPGGGRILFRPQANPYVEARGVGVIGSDGEILEFAGKQSFLYWDPMHPDGVLVAALDRERIDAYRLAGDRLEETGSWRVDDTVYASFSPDGRWIGFHPISRNGRPRFGVFRAVDRVTGRVTDLHREGFILGGWWPGGRIMAGRRDNEERFLWEPGVDRVTPLLDERVVADFFPPQVDEVYVDPLVSWSPDGRFFAVRVSYPLPRSEPRNGILIGRVSGRVVALVRTGERSVRTPTWSPSGHEVAFIVRGAGTNGHRRAHLEVFHAETGLRAVVADEISDIWWASWSPDGRWLLVDDWTRDRWLFLARDGSERVSYPRLGDNPIWCCPSRVTTMGTRSECGSDATRAGKRFRSCRKRFGR